MLKAENANLFKVVSDPQLVSEDRTGIAELCEELAEYLETEQVETVYRAYLVGARAHEGQSRVAGEPDISHPVAVARILAEVRMDCSSIVAAILHDVIEDTPATKEEVAEKFGDDVAELVDGVSKLTEFKFKNKKCRRKRFFKYLN